MRIIKNLNLTTSQFIASLIGGLALFLVPQDAKNMFNGGIFREFYVAGIAVLVVVLLFLIFKSYETIGISLLVVMTLIVANYTISNIMLNIYEPFQFHLDYYDSVCFFLIWMIPFLSCIIIRLFSFDSYDSDLFKEEFKNFMNLSTIAFAIYYIILLLAYFLFDGSVDLFSERDVNLILFSSNVNSNLESFQIKEYIKCFIYFIPLGFLVHIYKNKTSFWKRVLIAVCFGIFIELVQFSLNTATVSLWDVIFYTLGFIVGGSIKKLLDIIRRTITRGEESTIFDF